MKKISYALLALIALAMISCEDNNGKTQDVTSLSKSKLSDIDVWVEGMSSNLEYAAGLSLATYAPVIWNIKANSTTDFEDLTEGTFHAINNQGIAVGSYGESLSIPVRVENGKVTELERPNGEYNADVWAITSDGKTMAGFCYGGVEAVEPCYWTADGKIHMLPIPTSDEVGFEVNGAAVRFMSEDGAVMLGFLIDNYATWPITVWRRQKDGSYICDPICKEVFEDDFGKGKPYMLYGDEAGVSLSGNGKWATLLVQEEYDAWNGATPTTVYAARLNLVTGELEKTESLSAVTSISNDGTVLGFLGSEPTQRQGLIWMPGEKDAKQLNEVYNLDQLNMMTSVSPSCIAPNNAGICGFCMDESLTFYSFLIY